MVKTAVIGTGNWGIKLIDKFNKLSDLRWCCNEKNKEKLNNLKINYPRLQTTQNIEKILSDLEIEAVTIATPINTHYDLVKACLLNNKHVFVEKPLSESVTQSEELAELAKIKKKILSVGYIYLHSPCHQYIKKTVNSQKVKSISLNWLKWGSFKENILSNLVSHEIAILLDLLGKPDSVNSIYNQQIISKGDIFSLQLSWTNIKGNIYVNRVSNIKNKSILLECSSGIYLWEENTVKKYNSKQNNWTIEFSHNEDVLELEVNNFLNTINKNSPNLVDGDFAVKVDEILELFKKY